MSAVSTTENYESKRNYDHLKEAISAVQTKIDDVQSGKEKRINASCGMIFVAPTTDKKDTLILVGCLNKLARSNPKGPESVNNTFGLLLGNVELEDAQAQGEGSAIPALVKATDRDTRRKLLDGVSQTEIYNIINDPKIRLIKNVQGPAYDADTKVYTAAVLKNFVAVSFLAHTSGKRLWEIVINFKEKVAGVKQHEITKLAVISLNDLKVAQTKKNKDYMDMKLNLEAKRGTPFTNTELEVEPDLVKIFNTDVKLGYDVTITSDDARTLLQL